MKKYSIFLCIILTGICAAVLLTGCGEKKNKQAELVKGSWEQLKNKTHILLIMNVTGEWDSIVRIPDATLKIVESKKNAKGTWQIEKGKMNLTVVESDIEDVWAKNSTISYIIEGLTENKLQLKDASGNGIVWTRTTMGTAGETEGNSALGIPMAPVAVNINKNRTNEKDRYLCLKMKIILKELMPGQEPPPVHPKVHDAVITFFSSLVYDDVKDFHGIKILSRKLADIVNPLMGGMITEIAVEHVIVTAEIDKVDEFMIAYTESPNPASGKGKEGKNGKNEGKEPSKH
ncbi:MAG: flagellar basal body-associated FliL family protein [Desulfobacula sp.]|jgi:hypothetical protein